MMSSFPKLQGLLLREEMSRKFEKTKEEAEEVLYAQFEGRRRRGFGERDNYWGNTRKSQQFSRWNL